MYDQVGGHSKKQKKLGLKHRKHEILQCKHSQTERLKHRKRANKKRTHVKSHWALVAMQERKRKSGKQYGQKAREQEENTCEFPLGACSYA